MDDDKRISLKIDLSAGTIELDAPAADFDQAIARTKELAATLELRGQAPRGSPGASPSVQPEQAAVTPTAPINPPRSRARGVKGSAARSGRIGSFEVVQGLLSEEQEIDLRKFMGEKSPFDQVDQVIVAIVKGEQLLGRKGFSYNEIYSLMWFGGIKDLPKALDVVIQRMMQEQLVVKEGNGYAAKFIGRNRVENELPRAKASNE